MNEWLKFYEMSAPLVCLGHLISTDPVSVYACVQGRIQELGPVGGRGACTRVPLDPPMVCFACSYHACRNKIPQ